MLFKKTAIQGAFKVELEKNIDERGFFARSWCEEECEGQGLKAKIVQCNISYNKRKGTLRGMHYQAHPHEEAKLVRCTQGAIYDVIIDLRRASPTFGRWVSVVLSSDNRLMLYVPRACAHGFQTLTDDAEVFYQMTARYRPESARGVRWNDPYFRIEWPEDTRIISEKDRLYPDFAP